MSSKLSLEVLSPKFDSMARCIERIESKMPFSLDELQSDMDLQDIVSVNLSRLVQLSVDVATMIISRTAQPIPGTMADSFMILEKAGWLSKQSASKIKKSVGLRNIMIHEYEKIDWQIVHQVCNFHLDSFKGFASEIIQKASES